MEMHEKDQAVLHHDDDWSTTYPFQHNRKWAVYFINTVETRKLKKDNYNCSEDNSVMKTPCIANFWSKKIGCRLPWTKYIPENDPLKICTGKGKFTELRALMMTAFEPKMKQELIDEGCFQPNCAFRSWSIERSTEFGMGDCEKDCQSVFRFFFPQTDVVIRNEMQLYTVVNFFAEVGGYLGLLLGESLFSYFDVAWDATAQLIQIIFNLKKP